MINAFKKIWQFAGDESKNINKSIALRFLYAIFNMFQIGAIYYIIIALTQNDKSITPALTSFIFLIISIAGRTATSYFSQLQQTHAGFFMSANKRMFLGDKVKKIPMGFFNEHSLGEFTGIATSVLEDVENTATMVMVNILGGFINSIIFILMILFFDWRIGVIVILGTILYLIISSMMEKKSSILAPKRQRSKSELVSAILEHIHGMGVIKSFNLTGKGDKKTRDALENCRVSNINLEKLFTPYIILQEIILHIFSVAIILFSIYFSLNGTMNLANSLMCIIISFTIFAEISSAGSSLSILRVVSSSIEQANKMDNIEELDAKGIEFSPNKHNISFENVSFSYGKKEILHNISFDIDDKSLTAIIGPSGSGKTTICNLIARFWDIDSGSIKIGNKDIKEYTLDSLMSQISMVFQNVYLFADTIENNIKFGNPNASHEDVVNAAKKACCHDFIESLPDGYSTIIGENGSTLSGGEKQRISIARAMLKNAPIVIFDEATANVDPENEDKLQKAIEELTKNKTIIMIAHRLKTIKNADQILVVDDGNIVQRGNHEELVNQDGIYSRFVNSRKEAINWKI
ncbi:ABC transporter ATP-binding protein [Peptacetobacter sp.]|uniref:ABC transporter ATP-binding protein n=1 Tax=Peptacetobacter sp. TaxID=2991975 RepID=UPI00260A84FA|nr:ABC transporter ATP-binding protein [Peptacetobacter sp.]